MNNLLRLLCLIAPTSLFAQAGTSDFTVFNPNNQPKEWFITTNSGILNTPVGLKVGFLSSPGLYVGFRLGIGKVYHSDSDLTTSHTNLYSVTAGLNLPLIRKADFKLLAQLGAGYGQWWGYRWERWTRSGYEIEGGLMMQKGNFLFNVTGNVLSGPKTYATGDLCAGVGFVMNDCK
jgi:hypothetical protein